MYEELIRRLREEPLDSNKAALPIMDLCIDAATAIENLSHRLDMAQGERDAVTRHMIELEQEVGRLREERDAAIADLRKQEPVTNRNGLNEPLTMDELRQMDGEPVWIEDVGEDKWHGSGWAIVDREYCLVRKASNGNPAFFERYWKEWVAYRQKPEEGTV